MVTTKLHSLRVVTLIYIKITAFNASALQESTQDSKIIIRIVINARGVPRHGVLHKLTVQKSPFKVKPPEPADKKNQFNKTIQFSLGLLTEENQNN